MWSCELSEKKKNSYNSIHCVCIKSFVHLFDYNTIFYQEFVINHKESKNKIKIKE